MAKAFTDLGLDYDHLEATDRLGGNWALRVYDSVHLISSRATTQYADHPMPSDYPDFLSAAQMLAYLTDYATRFGLDRRIEFGGEAVHVAPLDARGRAGWRVQLVQRPESRILAGGPELRRQVRRMRPAVRTLNTLAGLLAPARDVPPKASGQTAASHPSPAFQEVPA